MCRSICLWVAGVPGAAAVGVESHGLPLVVSRVGLRSRGVGRARCVQVEDAPLPPPVRLIGEIDLVTAKPVAVVKDDRTHSGSPRALVATEQCLASTCVHFLREFRLHFGTGEFESLSGSIYVVNSASNVLLGQLSMQDLLLAPRLSELSNLMGPLLLSLRQGDTLLDAEMGLRNARALAAPVLDKGGVLLGIATATTVERTLDLRNRYLTLPIWSMAKARLPWLASLLLLQSVSSAILGSYQGLISKHVALALFLTMIIGTAGNAGTQSTASVIRAMATGEVSPTRDTMRVLQREVSIALILAGLLALIAFGRVQLTGSSAEVSVVVSVALFCTTVTASVIGTLAPLAFEILGVDPVNSSGPSLSTLTDVTGVLILGLVAYLLLGQS